MSYHAEISFKHIESITKLYTFISTFKQEISKNFNTIAKNDYCYCPFVNLTKDDLQKDYFDITFDKKYREIYRATEHWFERVFKYRWCYIKEWKLLGIYGVPECVQSLFDGTVYFQNSTDQDYEKIEYNGIKEFENIFDEWQNVSDENIKLAMKHYNHYTDEEIEEDLKYIDYDYYRKTLAYKDIWDKIKYSLYDDDAVSYISLYGFYDAINKQTFLAKCYEIIKEMYG